MKENNNLKLRDILNYKPKASKFGTSGVRALVSDLTDLEVYSLTQGALWFFKTSSKLVCGEVDQKNLIIPIAGDLRPSSDRLLRATSRAILDTGYDTDYMGKLPTPALTFYALENGIASFIVTGSHIPADRNGQKANRCDGEVLKTDEKGIVEGVKVIRNELYDQAVETSPFDENGMLKAESVRSLPEENTAAVELYKTRYHTVFPGDGLTGKRLLFFQYSAVGRDLVPEILRNCGAEVVEAGRSDQFVPIDTEAISAAHLQMLEELVVDSRKKYGKIDAVISTDGDSDRPLIVAVDETEGQHGTSVVLRFIPGDLLGLIVADYLNADSIAVPISTNPAVHEFFLDKGIATRKTRIGSPYVIEAMQQALSEGKNRVVSWEANGGFLLGSDIVVNNAKLKALPTRDAVLPILCVLFSAAEKKQSLTALFSDLPQWFGKAGLIDEFPQQASQKIVARFKPDDDRITSIQFFENKVVLWDVQDNVLGEWTMDDKRSESAIAGQKLLESVFSERLGFKGGIARINTQDGIRCFFQNDDIAHIRPSGNAPQLRIYAHARSQERADEIVELGLQEPDGMLRKLQGLVE